MIRYKNLITGEIKTAYQIGYDFMKDSFKLDKQTANPDNVTKEVIIKEGQHIANTDKNYKEVK